MAFDTKAEACFFKCKFTLFTALLSVLKSPSQLKKVEFNKNLTALFVNMSAGNFDIL